MHLGHYEKAISKEITFLSSPNQKPLDGENLRSHIGSIACSSTFSAYSIPSLFLLPCSNTGEMVMKFVPIPLEDGTPNSAQKVKTRGKQEKN